MGIRTILIEIISKDYLQAEITLFWAALLWWPGWSKSESARSAEPGSRQLPDNLAVNRQWNRTRPLDSWSTINSSILNRTITQLKLTSISVLTRARLTKRVLANMMIVVIDSRKLSLRTTRDDFRVYFEFLCTTTLTIFGVIVQQLSKLSSVTSAVWVRVLPKRA